MTRKLRSACVLYALVASTNFLSTATTTSSDIVTAGRPTVVFDPGTNSSLNDLGSDIPTSCEKFRRSIDEFPSDFFTEEQRRHGAIIVHLLVAFYGFIFITFVCHDYFLPSVFCICLDLGISPDVAGATFMATATCTSELFVAVIGTFLTESDLGVGTVVGSGVYNTLGVSACAGLAAGRAIAVETWPLLRDSVVYATSIAVLAAIAVDDVVQWYEALVMVLMFFGYFLILFTQDKLVTAAESLKKNKSFRSGVVICKNIKQLCSGALICRKITTNEESQSITVQNTRECQYYGTEKLQWKTPTIIITKTSESDLTAYEEQIISSPPKSAAGENILPSVWRIFCFPATFALSVTIPDCRNAGRKFYPFTFVMSIVWVSAVTYVLSWMLTICGDTFHVSDIVMGIAVLAVGSSIPEVASGIINARNGEGSMIISSALGSNTMDILLCLGLPWLVKCLLPASMNGGPVRMETDSLFFNCMCMISSVVILNAAAAVSGYKMDKLFGCACLVGQTAVIVVLIVNGLSVADRVSNNRCRELGVL